ncbi:hypothetical protein QR680_011476 [Steinernema hermaphroditum]|uniref:Protein kinase domain-containing protein n=1 Tax=Steinernema hermaphroditum TaxID=289476 RepID=A0AA39HYL7_9BILA|nr:hypothetical protein QR680_011476 [Steinernema hermaphroditum]
MQSRFQDHLPPTDIIPTFPYGHVVKIGSKSVSIRQVIAVNCKTRVYRVREGDENFVLKELLPSHPDYYECTTHQALNGHPHIVRYVDSDWGTVYRDRFLLLMEYAPFGDLRDVIRDFGPLRREVAWKFFDQIISAVGHMHRLGHVHDAIHPRNVFAFSSDLCKLGDFGNGTRINEDPRFGLKMTVREARDIQGAVDTLLFLLLGFWPKEDTAFWEIFEAIEKDEEARLMLTNYDLDGVVSIADLMYIRSFYHEDFYKRPIPEAYGRLRTSYLNEQLFIWFVWR